MSRLFKIKQSQLIAAFLLTPLLAACSINMNQNSIIEGVVQTAPLKNGKTLNVGYKMPDDAAQCQLVNDSSRNWAIAQSLGGIKLGGGRELLLDEAVDSVNQRPQDNINYVALTIPNEGDIGRINVTAGRDATTSYFRCVNPPQPH